MYKYPYGDSQQLNLDWILAKLKELETEGIGLDLEDVSNALISATFSSSNAYSVNDIVFHDGKLYSANVNIPAPGESWNPAHWDEILIGDSLSNVKDDVNSIKSQINRFTVIPDTYGTTDTEELFHEIANNLGPTKGYFITTRNYAAGANYGYFGQNYSVHLIFSISQWENTQYASGYETYASGIMFSENVKQIISFRQSGNSYNEIHFSDEINNLSGAINSNQLNVATVESGLTATRNYAVGDLVIVNGRLRRVIATILNGDTFVSGTNIATTELATEMQMKEYQGTIDSTFAAMGADSFYLRCYTYFHTFAIVWLSFYTPAVTPNTTITIGHFPAACKPAGIYSITWTGQKGGTYMMTFSSSGDVTLYCTDSTPQAQFVRCYIPLLVNS